MNSLADRLRSFLYLERVKLRVQYFPLIKQSSLDDFSLNGGWIELTADTDLTKVQDKYKFGTLEYKNGSSELALFQGWKSHYRRITSGMPLYRKCNILGFIANNNTKFVFIPEVSIEPIFTGPTIIPVVYNNWHMNRFSIVNFIPQNLSTKIFNKILLNFTLLDDWITPAFRFEEAYTGMQTKVKMAKPIVLAYFTYRGQLFKVELVGNISKKNGQNDKYVNYKNDSWILIEGENSISSEQAIFFATELRKMFSVVLARPLNTTQLSKKGIDRITHQSLTEDLYFLEMRFKNNKDKLLIYEMFQEKRDIQLNNLIPNWFNKGENFELLIQDYLLTISYNETVQNKLINLTEGIEAYYRDKDENLHQKLEDMLNSLAEYIQDTLEKNVGDLDTWLSEIKDTRVYIAHGDRKEHVIDDFMELSRDVDTLQYLTQYFILQELGMKIEGKERVKINLDSFFNTEEI